MKFNLDICHVFHIGNYNPLTSYSMQDVQLKGVDKENYLDVIITSELKPGSQYTEAVKTANKHVGFTEELSILNQKSDTLYNSLVRPYLEIW